MPETDKTITIGLQYKAVELISLNLTMPDVQPTAEQTFSFTVNLEHKFDIERKFVFVLVNIIINLEGAPDPAGEVLINNVFFVENYEEAVIEENGQPKGIRVPAAEVLNSVSISTARGVLSQQFRGTWLHNAILPILNPRDLQVVSK